MLKYIFSGLLMVFSITVFSQENKYTNPPYAVYKTHGKAVIAGSVNAYIYKDVLGKAMNDAPANAHSSPENLVHQLFLAMKKRDINAISALYDNSYNARTVNTAQLTTMLSKYDDIRFVSKFKTGNRIIVRYDFISSGAEKPYSYFAAINKNSNSYFLTTDINITDPFNIIGSLSPGNLLKKPVEQVDIKSMVPFYFVTKDNKVMVTNRLPRDEYTGLYFAFEKYTIGSVAPEISFLKQLQQMAQKGDTAQIKELIAPADRKLLSDPYFGNYYYGELLKIMYNFTIKPAAALSVNNGKIIYFRYTMPNTSIDPNVSSVILTQEGGKWYLAFHTSDGILNNILQNVYIKEALVDYFNKQ